MLPPSFPRKKIRCFPYFEKHHRFLKQKLNRFLCILSPNRQITQSNVKIGIKLFYRRGKSSMPWNRSSKRRTWILFVRVERRRDPKNTTPNINKRKVIRMEIFWQRLCFLDSNAFFRKYSFKKNGKSDLEDRQLQSREARAR